MNRTVPELNVPLLEAVSAKIADEPEHFDMGNWACGTELCIAGHAVVLAGGELQWSAKGYANRVVMPGNENRYPEHIEVAAMAALGLTEDEAAHLFYGKHDEPDTARRAIKDLIESRQGGVA